MMTAYQKSVHLIIPTGVGMSVKLENDFAELLKRELEEALRNVSMVLDNQF